ncbi:MAG: type II toxin-antitoxin system VapC family toxin [Methylobacter sp.]|nr:MAG: type II toxin-antitoxin system VapC family toxin [Methylobacter sp.]
MNYLLDTNVISELKRPKPNGQVVDWFATADKESLYLSVLTLGEIRKGIDKLADGQKKQTLSSWLEKELPLWFDSRLLVVDAGVADCWGKLQAQINRPLPAIDSLLAATALHHNLCLVTRNVSDFDYPGLMVLNLWQ